MRRIQAGTPGPTDWSTLLAGYQDRLFGVCLRMVGNRETAADICQDAMVKIIKGLGSYDQQSKLSTWMIRVAMNTCLSHIRAAKLRKTEQITDGSSLDKGLFGTGSVGPDEAREPDPVWRVQQGEAQHLLAEALQRLESEQRAILVLRDVRGLDYDQIAHVLGVAEGTVKSRLFRARAALREIVESLTPRDRRKTP